MTIKKIITIVFAVCAFSLQAADSNSESRQWAEVPFSKCTTMHQKMKCAFAQNSCKVLSPAEQAEIQQKRIANRANIAYIAPAAPAEALTTQRTALFMTLVKTKAIDTE